jgi:hypothetical protein
LPEKNHATLNEEVIESFMTKKDESANIQDPDRLLEYSANDIKIIIYFNPENPIQLDLLTYIEGVKTGYESTSYLQRWVSGRMITISKSGRNATAEYYCHISETIEWMDNT